MLPVHLEKKKDTSRFIERHIVNYERHDPPSISLLIKPIVFESRKHARSCRDCLQEVDSSISVTQFRIAWCNIRPATCNANPYGKS